MRILERILAITLFLSSMTFFVAVLYGKELTENTIGTMSSGELHPGVTAINILLYAAAGFFMVRRYRRFLTAIIDAWPLLALSLFCLLSSAWSIDPGLTFRRSGFLLGSTLFGIYLGGRYSIATISRLLLMAFFMLCGFSLIYRLIAPAYVLDAAHDNVFRGLTNHKNTFGEYMAIFFLQLILYSPAKGMRAIRYASIPLAFVLMIGSHSSTSAVVCVLVACLIPILGVFRLPLRQRWPALLLLALGMGAVAVLATSLTDTFFAVLGKDATLTGRSTIWREVVIDISRRPWLGYGFDVFWQGLKGESLNVIAAAGWLVPAAHNGYLEALLGIGIVGLVIVLFCAALMFKRAVEYTRRVPGFPGLWPLAFLLFYLMHSFAESTLITRSSLDFLLFATLYTALAMFERDRGGSPASRELNLADPAVEAQV